MSQFQTGWGGLRSTDGGAEDLHPQLRFQVGPLWFRLSALLAVTLPLLGSGWKWWFTFGVNLSMKQR